MIFLKSLFKLLLILCVFWVLYKDSKRLFKAFFIHLERKLLVVHSLKLALFLMLIYKFRSKIPLYETLFIFVFILLLLFLSLLTIKQVELKMKGTINSKYKTFKYGGRLVQYLLYLTAALMNFGELKNNKQEIKEKSKEAMFVAIFPVQKYIMVSISELKFTQRKSKFISETDLKEIRKKLEPGDILLKRNDWQATNLGISGFWTHTGLYMGSLKELDEYFRDVDVLKGKRFSEKLKEINKEVYKGLVEDNDLAVIEAIEEGVVVKPLSNIARVDYFSAVRPKLSKEKKMNAILKAYNFVGRPYDYYIDMNSEDAFICSKVISKSFHSDITFEIVKKAGKKVVLPNSIAKKYTLERNKENRELDFVLFYDLNVRSKKAYESTESEFTNSYKRNIKYYRKRDMLRYLSTILEIK